MSLMDQFKISSMKPSLSKPWRDQVDVFVQGAGEFVQGVQEELGVLDELRYEWHRLQTFVGWPLQTPRPIELAKAGFYFAPTEDAPDGCGHFCTDKFFSAWEKDDDPWTVLRDNCPECPIITGTSTNVPLPYSYNPTKEAQQSPASHDKQKEEKGFRNLGSYLSGAVERVGVISTGDPEPEAAHASATSWSDAAHIPYTLGAAAAGLGRFWGSGGASDRSASPLPASADLAAEEMPDLGDLQVTSKTKKKGKKTAAKPKQANQPFIEEDPVYSKIFDAGMDEGDFPPAQSDFPAAQSDFPPALAPSASVVGDVQNATGDEPFEAPMATGSTQEWVTLRVSVMGSVAKMKSSWEGQMTSLDARLVGMKSKVNSLSSKVGRLAQQDWLQNKRNEIQEADVELQRLQQELQDKSSLLAELDAKVQARAGEVEKLSKHEELAAACEKRTREAEQQLAEMNESKMNVQKELEMLALAKESMGNDVEKERLKIQGSLQGMLSSQREAQAALLDLQDTIERRKREIDMYEVQLEEFGRREEKFVTRQTELDARERGIKAKEADIKSREEWLLQKEGEQRAAGKNVVQRGSNIAPRVTREGLAPIPQDMESRLQEAEEEDDMDSKREEMLARMMMAP